MGRVVIFLCAAFVFGWATTAFGDTVIIKYGDKDDFDGFLSSDGSVDFVDHGSKDDFVYNPREEDDDSKTDFLTGRSDLPLKWTQSYDSSGIGIITGATLEIFAAGLGVNRNVYIDDQFAGTLTKGEVQVEEKTVNYARRDILELSPSLYRLLDGEMQVRIGDPFGINDKADNFALDYCFLTIAYEPLTTPAPPGIVLLGSGLMGIVVLKRKR